MTMTMAIPVLRMCACRGAGKRQPSQTEAQNSKMTEL